MPDKTRRKELVRQWGISGPSYSCLDRPRVQAAHTREEEVSPFRGFLNQPLIGFSVKHLIEVYLIAGGLGFIFGICVR